MQAGIFSLNRHAGIPEFRLDLGLTFYTLSVIIMHSVVRIFQLFKELLSHAYGRERHYISYFLLDTVRQLNFRRRRAEFMAEAPFHGCHNCVLALQSLSPLMFYHNLTSDLQNDVYLVPVR